MDQHGATHGTAATTRGATTQLHRRGRLAAAALAAVALALLPGRAALAGGASPHGAGSALRIPRGHVVRQTFPVETRVRTQATDGCSHELSVRGVVVQVEPRPGAPDRAGPRAYYLPNVRLDTAVRCPDGRVADVEPRFVIAPARDLPQLERALADRGTVSLRHAARRCTYTPRVAFEAGAVAVRSVGVACRPSTDVRARRDAR